MTTSRRTRLVCLLVGLALAVAACGSDSDDAAPDGSATDATSADAPADTDADEQGAGTGGASVPSDLPLESVVRGLEVAMDPEDVQIDGDTLHVYIDDDNSRVPLGTECSIVLSVLPDGATAVIHRGGEETTC